MPMLSQIITIPADTPSDNPHVGYLDLMVGHLYRIDVGFRKGCNNYVKIQIFDELVQVVPALEGQYLAWDNYIFITPVSIDISVTEKRLTVLGWSDNSFYPHDIYFWTYYEDRKVVSEAEILDGLVRYVPSSVSVE